MLEKSFGDYWERGAFPEVANVSRQLRVKIHQEYFHSILFRDLVERHNIPHPRAVVDLARRLFENIGSLHSVNSLTGYLHSLSHKTPKRCFSAITARIHDASNPRQSYEDLLRRHSFVQSGSSGILLNSGHLLENLVYITLRRSFPEIFYYRTRNAREVDFAVPIPQGLKLIQSCYSLVDPSTRQRELKALQEAMQETGVREGLIVTRDTTEQIETPDGSVEVVPVWRWLLTQRSFQSPLSPSS